MKRCYKVYSRTKVFQRNRPFINFQPHHLLKFNSSDRKSALRPTGESMIHLAVLMLVKDVLVETCSSFHQQTTASMLVTDVGDGCWRRLCWRQLWNVEHILYLSSHYHHNCHQSILHGEGFTNIKTAKSIIDSPAGLNADFQLDELNYSKWWDWRFMNGLFRWKTFVRE